MNEHILIVEDEAVLFHRMKKILSKESFIISDYTPSVAEALDKIKAKRPDLVLLDIKLQGPLSGIDLGKMLYETYHIPFIYVTDFDNDMFFAKALATHHEQYLVKTKPRINAAELKRAIYTALQKQEKPVYNQKLGIRSLVNYLDIIKDMGENELRRKNVPFDQIAFFTGDIKFLENYNNDFRKNYIWFITKNHKLYFLKTSLKKIYRKLPENFARANDHYIVNLLPPFFEGRINTKKIRVQGEIINLSDSFKADFNQKYDRYYVS